jgi:hypothetical protein
MQFRKIDLFWQSEKQARMLLILRSFDSITHLYLEKGENMTKIQILEVASEIASILSLIITIFVASQVIKIKINVSNKMDIKQSAKGDSNVQIGGNNDVR